MGGHDPIFQKLCRLLLSLFGTNRKQIRKSVLTTFEALFMQNAQQIIVEKVIKTASKHQF